MFPYIFIIAGAFIYFKNYGLSIPQETSMILVVSAALVITGLISLLKTLSIRN